MSIDWIEGATHYHENTRCFYKKVEGVWNLMSDGMDHGRSSSLYNGEISEYDLIERPKQQQAWSGPEDGLPPIGLEVEATYDDGSYSWGYWLNTKVLCYGEERTFVNQLSRGTEDTWIEGAITSAGLKYRPIKTAEQLAAEKKGRDVTDMLCIVTSSELKGRGLSAQLEALYDAGFKREVV